MHVASACLEGPCALWLVLSAAFEELVVKRSGRVIKCLLLFRALHISEMLVVSKLLCRGLSKATESLVSAYLMLRGHLKGINGADLAVIFNCVNDKS